MMKDVGFNGSGNRFVPRFQAGAPIFASQLNDLASGLGVVMPQPSVGGGVSTSFTSTGTVVTALPSGDSGYGLSDPNPEQFKCRIWTVPQEVGAAKHYLQIAQGNVTFCTTSFPFTQGTTSPGDGQQFPGQLTNFKVDPAQQVCLFDVAISPTGSRSAGTMQVSPWMANSGTFELDPEVGNYYVTVSWLDYNDMLDWHADEALINTHVPWVSIVASTGPSKNSIFSPDRPTGVTNYVCLGDPISWNSITPLSGPGPDWPPKLNADGMMPTLIGYSMKVLARLSRDSDSEVWIIRQELFGPVTFDQNIVYSCLFDQANFTAVGAVYGTYLSGQFISSIDNYSYLTFFADSSFSDSDILNPATTEWWYDVKTV